MSTTLIHTQHPSPPYLQQPCSHYLAKAVRSFSAALPYWTAAQQHLLSTMSIIPKGGTLRIREVWAHNLEEEFELIRDIVDDFPYLAMDTEFPGVVVRPAGTFKNIAEYHYQTLRGNVDRLKLIQLGLTFSDEEGTLPRCGTADYCVWQFNFQFNLKEDMYAQDSIDLLCQSGIDFNLNEEQGIESQRFGEMLMSSGIVLNESVHWITFHSGYDFGYLLKLLTRQNLPASEAVFFNLLRTYFPTVYDIKYLIKFCSGNLHGGLNRLAEMLGVQRIGACHQAGSDSLLTSCTFRKLTEGNFFNGTPDKYRGVLYGLGA